MRIFKICTKKNRGDNKKASWPEIGVVFENDKGQMSGYLNNNPDTQIYLFEQEQKQGQQPAQQPGPDSSVPF